MSAFVAPHSEEAERGVLGAILQADDRTMLLAQKAKVSEESFYVPGHRMVWRVASELSAAGRPVDLLTVSSKLRDGEMLELVGGQNALEGLIDATPTTAHSEYYISILMEKHARRRIVDASRLLIERAVSDEGTPADVVSRGMASLESIGSDVMPEVRSNADVVHDLIANWKRALDTRQNGQEHLPGLHTPYQRYNEIMGGLQPGLHFFGGKSSSGKTTMVLNICRHFLRNGHHGLVIQLDDTHDDMIGRLCSMEAGVSLPALAQGFSKRHQLEKIESEVAPAIEAMGLHVVEECDDVNHARALARYHKARYDIKWMVIDYVQVLDADGNPRDDERIRLGKIATACKRMWKELRIPVMVVSQTSKFKDAEDNGRKADMSELFGASELSHAATSVFILKAIRKSESRGEPMMPLEMPLDATGFTKRVAVAGHVVKNKHGPKDCSVFFWGLMKYFQFTECEMVRENGIWRQRTWEEEIEINKNLLAQQAKKPDWAP